MSVFINIQKRKDGFYDQYSDGCGCCSSHLKITKQEAIKEIEEAIEELKSLLEKIKGEV